MTDMYCTWERKFKRQTDHHFIHFPQFNHPPIPNAPNKKNLALLLPTLITEQLDAASHPQPTNRTEWV